MPYSDEPKIVKERPFGRKQWVAAGVSVLFIALFGGSLLWQWNHNRIRDHMPRGEHGGFLHTIGDTGWQAEILRAAVPTDPEQEALYVCVSHSGHSHDHVSGLIVEARAGDGNWTKLPWNDAIDFYGPAPSMNFPHNRDRRVTLRILQDGNTVWEQEVWAFSGYLMERHGHGHGHGHSH